MADQPQVDLVSTDLRSNAKTCSVLYIKYIQKKLEYPEF